MRAPIRLWGSKEWLAPRVIELLPPHRVYVEVFGGTGAVLLAKEPSPVEVFNDINQGCTNFYRVLRDQSDELVRRLALTPFSRQEYEDAKVGWRNTDDPIEKARQWFLVAGTSFSGKWGQGFSISTRERRGMAEPVSAWLSRIDRLPAVHERLKKVIIECANFSVIITRFDHEEACFYIDPPYVRDTRVAPQAYQHEFSNDDHEELVRRLLAIQGSAVVSGYDHPIYTPLEDAGWARYEVPHRLTSGPVRGERKQRIEILWVKESSYGQVD